LALEKEIAMPLTPSRVTSGISTATPIGVLANLPIPAPTNLYGYYTDFSTYLSGEWTVTSINSGTTALTDGEGGFALQTTGATSTNYQANELVAKSFYFKTGFQKWFTYSFNLSDTAHTLMLAGLVDTLSGPMTPSKGVYFSKTDASTTLNLILKGAGTTTIAVGTIAAATQYSVGFYYDARSTPTLYVYSSIGTTLPVLYEYTNPIVGGLVTTSAGNNASSGTLLTNLPTATDALKIGFGITTGANAAHTNTVDYIGAWSEVQRF
jgi:hypothetical protein